MKTECDHTWKGTTVNGQTNTHVKCTKCGTVQFITAAFPDVRPAVIKPFAPNPEYTEYKGKCPKCSHNRHIILNASMPTVNQCTKCGHMWNPNNESVADEILELAALNEALDALLEGAIKVVTKPLKAFPGDNAIGVHVIDQAGRIHGMFNITKKHDRAGTYYDNDRFSITHPTVAHAKEYALKKWKEEQSRGEALDALLEYKDFPGTKPKKGEKVYVAPYKYVGKDKESGLHVFDDGEGKQELFAKHPVGEGDAGWHLKRKSQPTHVYEFVRDK